MDQIRRPLKLVTRPRCPPTGPRRDIIFYAVPGGGPGHRIGLSILREFMDDTVKSPDDVEEQLALNPAGDHSPYRPKKSRIWRSKRHLHQGKKAAGPQLGLMMGPQNEESVVAEAHRSLRTNIVFSALD